MQRRLRCTWPEPEARERIRPATLSGQFPAENVRQTGTSRRLLYRGVAAFTQLGMDGPSPETADLIRRLPEPVRRAILDLKAGPKGQSAPLNLRMVATICYAHVGRQPGHDTMERVLAEGPLPPNTARRFPPDHAIPDAVDRRLAPALFGAVRAFGSLEALVSDAGSIFKAKGGGGAPRLLARPADRSASVTG